MGRRSSLPEDSVSVKNPIRILVVWSLKKISTKFSILSDLLRNLNLTKIKLCSFFPAQQLTYMKNYFDTIEELSIGSHLLKINNWCQNPYGCKTNYKFIFGPFFSFNVTLLFVLHFALEPLCLSFNVTLLFVLRFALEPLCFRNIKLKPILENKFERPMSFIPQS